MNQQGYDLYMTCRGKKIASVWSYNATLSDSDGYHLNLESVYPTDEALNSGIDFAQLPKFDVVINTPSRKIMYMDCQAQQVEECGGQMFWRIDTIQATADNRTEIATPMKEGFGETENKS